MVTKIYKGDSTNAGGRAILIALPEDENFDGEAVAFEFLGKRIVEDNPEAGGSIRVEFTAEETARMPLGTHFARLSIIHAGAEHTVSATIPIKVTDDVADVYGGDASTIYLTMRYCAGIPDLADIDHAPKTANALASAFHALLQKLQGGVALSLAILCTACLGDSPKTAPIGDIPFSQQIVTNQTAAFAPMSHVEDRDNPHGVTARQIGAVSANDVAALVDRRLGEAVDGKFVPVTGGTIVSAGESDSVLAIGNGGGTARLSVNGGLVSRLDIGPGSGYLNIGTDNTAEIRAGHYDGRLYLGEYTGLIDVGDGAVVISADYDGGSIKIGGKEVATKDEIAAGVDPELEGRVAAIGATVSAWEGYWGGSNVVWEVTNYYGNTSGELPKLRLKELITDGEGAPFYREVWNDLAKFEIFTSNLTQKVEQEVAAAAAPKAWGTVTDKGEDNVVENSVWMTSPQTIFAGGTEYQRVAVGEGAICVLTARGAEAYTTGDAGTFRFQDEGGTNYFGFAKTDSYTIGCDTDGIKVEGCLVTLTYNVVMAGNDVPVIYYRPDLTPSSRWVQLNNEDGSAADGAPYSVTFGKEGAKHLAFLNVGDAPSGFFKAETSVAGDVVFETNMKMRLDGGVLCTDGQTIIYPHADGTWSTTK